MPVAVSADLFRPTDPGFLADPYPSYARLRNEAPIAFYDGWEKWIVTRYRDVDRLLRDRRLGRVIHHRIPEAERPPRDPRFAAFDAIQQGSLLEIEPPDHTRVKQVVHDLFTPKHVRALRGRIEGIVEERLLALEGVPEREVDLITAFAEPLPVTVIAELLGVPERERAPLLPWSKAIIGMFEPERTPEMEAEALRASAEFADYVRSLMARKRRAPGDDLVSRMVEVHDADPTRLSEGEVVANAILFLDAGHEAVVNVIGNGMLALLRHPDQLRAVRDDPGLVATAVEEMMRFDTPLQFFERFVLEDMTEDGLTWPQGTKVCLYYASANRDPEVFEHANRFDVRRDPNPHLAFGLGIHYCIGAPLARLELGVALSALLARFPNLELRTETPSYHPKNVFRYLRELRVGY
jgi:cytochrome P450